MSRADSILESHHESSEKFDYFVTGATGALFAYIAQTYTPRQMTLDTAVFEPVALFLLLLSLWFGFKRIECTTTAKALNFRMLNDLERAGKLASVLMNKPNDHFFTNAETGGTMTRTEMEGRIPLLRESGFKAQKSLDETADRALKLYKRRNFFLILGFAAILAGKLLEPYSVKTPFRRGDGSNAPPSSYIGQTNRPRP